MQIMASLTPHTLTRRTNARIAAGHSKVKAMEQRAHNRAVQVYAADIYDNLTVLEDATRPNAELIASQPQINVAMRNVLLEFLLEVHNRLKLANQTFYLTVSIIDRYCSLRIVRKDHFQLLGLTSLWLAAKFGDHKNKVPSLDFLRATCCQCYAKSLFVEMESHILKSLCWEVGSACHDSFIDLSLRERFMDSFKLEQLNQIRYSANYLCQRAQLHHDIALYATPSQTALAAVLIAACATTLTNDLRLVQHHTTVAAVAAVTGVESIENDNHEDNDELDLLVAKLLALLRGDPVPAAFKARYFSHGSDTKVNPSLHSLHNYAAELYAAQQEGPCDTNQWQCPQTPMSSPLNSAKASPSSHRAPPSITIANSQPFLLTPPTSGSASPLYDYKNNKYSDDMSFIVTKQQQQTRGTAIVTTATRKRPLEI